METQRNQRAGAGRVLWIIWCCGWAGLWLTLGVLSATGGYSGSAWGRVLVWALAIGSVAAIFLPIGRDNRE